MVVRIPAEVKKLMEKTAAHIGRDMSFIARAVIRTMERRGASVMQRELAEMYNKGESVLVCFRNIELPAGMTHADFRNTLVSRCREALSRPGVGRFRTSLVEGRDYVLVNDEE